LSNAVMYYSSTKLSRLKIILKITTQDITGKDI